MTVKAFAKKFDMTEDEMWEALKENGYLKGDYSPKTKYINDEMFDEDGNIVDAKTLKAELDEVFAEDEDDSDEDEDTDDEDEEMEEDDESEDDSDDEVSIDTIKENLDNVDMSKEEIAELISILTDKLVNYEESDDLDDEEDYDEDEEDEDEEEEKPKSKKKGKDEDPNAEGKYRGWTITKKGIFMYAKKGKEEIKSSIKAKGGIRGKIDEYED